jgi:hypothetical protein
MVQEDVLQWLKARPFREFEIITTAGAHHIVKHPEFAILSPTAIVVLDPTTDRFSFLALMHITEIRPTETAHSETTS